MKKSNKSEKSTNTPLPSSKTQKDNKTASDSKANAKTEIAKYSELDDESTVKITLIEQNHYNAETKTSWKLSQEPEGKYKVKYHLCAGGMKSIIKVKDRDSGRDVAMASMHTPENKSDVSRFIQEAKIAANLEHPNIVPVHDIGLNSSGDPYFVMKLLGGETLGSIIQKLKDNDPKYIKTYNLHLRLNIFVKICNAIAFAHSKGIIHLDLKPENIQIGDFGEVLVLDWGLAKVIGAPEENIPVENKNKTDNYPTVIERLRDTSIELTIDGIIKGTPGFMAPEQVQGKNTDKNEKTDIYALGALLYNLLTLEKPFTGDSSKKVMIKTITEPVIPPRIRTPNYFIPKSIEAVTLKALAFEPKDRYSNVQKLISDIDAFLGGYATSAEKAGFFKHLFLMVKRHKTVTFLLSLFLITGIMFGSYVLLDHYRQWGNWTNVYSEDFSTNTAKIKNLFFLDPLIKDETAPWQQTSGGLQMAKMHWVWLKNTKVRGDNKVIIEIMCKGRPEAFEICINSQIQDQLNNTHVPPGYSFQFGAWNGRGNIISKNIKSQLTDTTNNVASNFESGKLHKLTLERKDGKISMSVDGIKSLEIIDYFPPTGKKLSQIGFRSYSSSTYLQSIKVYRWALPEKTSPLIAGDALAEYQFSDEAIAKYLTIAENREGTKIASEALLKAYLTASSNDIAKQRNKMKEIKLKMMEKYPESNHCGEILEQEALYSWKYDKELALALLPKLFEAFPDNKVMLKILQLKHEKLPKKIGQALLSWISKSKNIRELNISRMGLKNIDKLQGLQLTSLDCSWNSLNQLDAIAGMQLENLNCAGCEITSLEPLRGMKLKDLIISNNKINNLTPLTGMPIERLRCRINKLTSIQPLKGMPLKRLECGGNQITDLSPIANAPLSFLGCRKNQIKSLAPLKNIKLSVLDSLDNPIQDITPLQGMPLKELLISNCPIKDLKPLLKCRELEKLTIPEKHGNIEFLKKLPRLKYLDTKWNIPLKKAETFWNEQ